jgi:tRNA U34 5-carboxymethylaminomethyl modifying GTPase MnmE/TrmE
MVVLVDLLDKGILRLRKYPTSTTRSDVAESSAELGNIIILTKVVGLSAKQRLRLALSGEKMPL